MIVVWFSAGITSTIAGKLALDRFKNVQFYYFDTGQVHPDNGRFIKECEHWYGQEIIIMKAARYNSPIHVALKERYINGPAGAKCTTVLKKQLRYKVQEQLKFNYQHQVFGFEYTKREIIRAERFHELYPEAKAIFPLIEAKLSKKDCLGLLENAGIKRPAMYDLGYKNNNCIGCFKGGAGYWNKIREDFPAIFETTAKMERDVGATCIRLKGERVYLDELDPKRGNYKTEKRRECGVVCEE